MVPVSLEAADNLAKEGVEVEVIDLRSLLPFDKEKILQSVKKTNKSMTWSRTYLDDRAFRSLLEANRDLVTASLLSSPSRTRAENSRMSWQTARFVSSVSLTQV